MGVGAVTDNWGVVSWVVRSDRIDLLLTDFKLLCLIIFLYNPTNILIFKNHVCLKHTKNGENCRIVKLNHISPIFPSKIVLTGWEDRGWFLLVCRSQLKCYLLKNDFLKQPWLRKPSRHSHFFILDLFNLLPPSDALVLVFVSLHLQGSKLGLHLFCSPCMLSAQSSAWPLESTQMCWTCFLLRIFPSCSSLRPFHHHCLEAGLTVTSPCCRIHDILNSVFL